MSSLRPVPAPANDDSDRFLDALVHGDEAAFEQLVLANYRRLLMVARRMLGSEQDAEDAVQDGLIAAFRALPRFQRRSRVSTWLHRIVVNQALMQLRSRRRKPEESLDVVMPDLERSFDRSVCAERAYANAQLAQAVEQAMERLPEAYRAVVSLRDFAELDTVDTARVLDISPNAVKMRLHRARQSLRVLMVSYADHDFAESRAS